MLFASRSLSAEITRLNIMDIEIIISKPLSGEENMRLDKENLIKAEVNDNKVFVRIYEWLRPTISLGISQSPDEFDLKKIRHDGIDLVKRITGGKAVWHHKEITYCVAAGIPNAIFGNSLYLSYKIISEILLLFLTELNLKAQVVKKKKPNLKSNICYQQSGLYEITMFEKKLIGSAQKRTNKAFLQHGSIPVFSSQASLNKYLFEPTSTKHQDFLYLENFIENPNIEIFKNILKKTFYKELNKLAMNITI